MYNTVRLNAVRGNVYTVKMDVHESTVHVSVILVDVSFRNGF